MFCMTLDHFRSSREVIPVEGHEPLGSEIGFPLGSDQFLEHLWSGSGFLVDSGQSLVQVGSGVVLRIHSLWS